ncbi:hypothetical protein ACFW1A_23110 [Kitasatospora sp. NPDC058965]|uniref:hypothetical protein n=1 Tax=Kitasatospora sp. NPDC058965 TaxID=3346682 RepID=UPI0036CCF6B3
MKTRSLATALAALACSALTLTACGPDETSKTAAPAPAASASPSGAASGAAPGAGTAASAAPTAGRPTAQPTAATVPADVPLCGNSEKESDVKGELVGLDHSADPRWTAVVKLTNTLGKDCVMYGAADVETDHTAQFSKLVTSVLGQGTFATDRAHGTLLRAGASVYLPVTWLSSPPIAPNATCTTGDQLAVGRNEGVLLVSMPLKDARFCPMKDEGSPQVLLGVPQADLAAAKAQLQNVK